MSWSESPWYKDAQATRANTKLHSHDANHKKENFARAWPNPVLARKLARLRQLVSESGEFSRPD